MKKLIIYTILLVSFKAIGQIDTTISLDLLRASTSPASTLVGIATSEVQRQTDLNAFAVSLQNATNSFSKIPANYAIDIAPAWAVRGNRITVNEIIDPKQPFRKMFWQNTVVSLAVKNSSDTKTEQDSTQLGIGLKFSLIKGRMKEEEIAKIHKTIDILNRKAALVNQEVGRKLDSVLSANGKYVQLRRKIDSLQRKKDLGTALTTDEEKELSEMNAKKQETLDLTSDALRKKAEAALEAFMAKNKLDEIKWDRYGWTLDLAAGLAFNSNNQVFDETKLYKLAFWLTGGYNAECGLSFLGIARYQYNPDKVFADSKNLLKRTDVNTFDIGGSLSFSNPESRFMISSEYIYRSVLNNSEIKPTWRLILNTSYEIKKNYQLTFSLGRDFDKKVYKDGSLMAALNLVAGFGNKRKL